MVWRYSHQSESLLQNSVPLRRVPLLFFCPLTHGINPHIPPFFLHLFVQAYAMVPQ